MWNSILSSDKTSTMSKSITDALERAGEAMTRGASHNVAATSNVAAKQEEGEDSNNKTTDTAAETPTSPQSQSLLLSQRFQKGWGSMVEATSRVVEVTREAVEKESTRLDVMLHKSSGSVLRPRDVKLPLDKPALRDAEVVYITDRIISMGHPYLQSTYDGDITPERKLAAVAHLLNKRHSSKYMIWNLSEVEYPTSLVNDQVLVFRFPGSPSPPLGLWLKLVLSMESWLKADSENVCVVHCLTGKGRTCSVLAAFLCWMGEAGFGTSTINQCLEYISECKQIEDVETLTIPSQRRYIQYFNNMLDGVRPSQPPLLLKRIILSQAPKFAKGPPRTTTTTTPDDNNNMGCAPYMQLFRAGNLLFTTAATLRAHQKEDELPFCYSNEGSISFHIECVVQGDVLIRCRHLTAKGQRVSMFRAAFHTGYVGTKSVMRLGKQQLDGACHDDRFSDDFFVDVIFEPCDAEMASKHMMMKESESGGEESSSDSKNEAAERRARGIMGSSQTPTTPSSSSGAATVTASAYDSMLHRDSRFWDVIAARRQEHAGQQQQQEATSSKDEMWGPTIGRRRDLNVVKKNDEKQSATPPTTTTSTTQHQFSIGGEFDFFDVPEAKSPSPTKPAVVSPKQRDELMEALNALEDEATSPVASPRRQTVVMPEVEEIVFFEDDTSTNKNEPTTNIPDESTKDTVEKVTATEETSEKEVPTGSTVETKQAPPPTTTTVSPPPAKKQDTSTAAVDEALLEDPDLLLDGDVDALLASAGANNDDDDEDIELPDDLDDLDFDEDMEDLENLLSKAAAK